MQKRDDKPGVKERGKWNFVGGGMEGQDNGDPYMTALREVYEEIGVTLIRAQLERLGILNHTDEADPWIVHVIKSLRSIEAKECIRGEGERLQFFTREQLDGLDLTASSQEIITEGFLELP